MIDAPRLITLSGDRVTLEPLSKTQAVEYLSIGQDAGIYRVSANGGNLELIIPVEGRPYGPRLLPDWGSVLFTVTPTPDWDTAQIVSQSLSTGERTALFGGGKH